MSVVCVRCGVTVPFGDMGHRCPRAPDNGPHEGISPPECRPRGWSTHIAGCPRAQPFIVGVELVDAACICADRPRKRQP